MVSPENRRSTYIATENLGSNLEEKIKNNPDYYKNLGMKTENIDVKIVKNKKLYPDINNYMNGLESFLDDYLIVAGDKNFIVPTSLYFIADNEKDLEESIFPFFEKTMNTELLKFEKSTAIYEDRKNNLKKDMNDKIFKFIFTLLVFSLINIFVFLSGLINISKRVAVNLLLGNSILSISYKLILFNIIYSLSVVLTLACFLNIDSKISLIVLGACIIFDFLVFSILSLYIRKNGIKLLKSSMEE